MTADSGRASTASLRSSTRPISCMRQPGTWCCSIGRPFLSNAIKPKKNALGSTHLSDRNSPERVYFLPFSTGKRFTLIKRRGIGLEKTFSADISGFRSQSPDEFASNTTVCAPSKKAQNVTAVKDNSFFIFDFGQLSFKWRGFIQNHILFNIFLFFTVIYISRTS